MANHACPSCGYLHASEGAEVPAIVLLRDQPEIRPRAGEVIPDQPRPPAVFSSKCPLCAFTSAEADEFNAHMSAGQHGQAAVDSAAVLVYHAPAPAVEGESLSDLVARILAPAD